MNLNKIIPAIVLCTFPTFLFAQAAERGDPIAAANAVDACGGNPVIDAVWQDDGRLAVTCPSGSVENASNGGGATNFAIPAIIALVVGAAAIGGSGSTSDTN